MRRVLWAAVLMHPRRCIFSSRLPSNRLEFPMMRLALAGGPYMPAQSLVALPPTLSRHNQLGVTC